MDTFPFSDWMEPCLEVDADGACTVYDYVGYFPWADSSEAGLILAWLAIIVSVISGLLVTLREDKLLNHAADRLADKYSEGG